MIFGKKSRKKYGLVSSARKTLLIEQSGGRMTSSTSQDVISKVQKGLDDIDTVDQLLAGLRPARGDVYISLPLNHFEIINLAINKIPEEALGKVIPFPLGKALDEPLDDFIYDWQITKRKRDSLAVAVVLFPRVAYQRFADDFQRFNLSCKTLEPDIYSAIIFLEKNRRIAPADVSIVMVVWDKSISIGVYEQESFSVIRSVNLKLPDVAFSFHQSQEIKGPQDEDAFLTDEALSEQAGAVGAQFPDSPKTDNVLADFLISTKHDEQPLATGDLVKEKRGQDGSFKDLWEVYFDQVHLELMRTRDYYNSMIKGEAIRKVFIGCRADLFKEMKPVVMKSLDLQVENLTEHEADLDQYDPYLALGSGAFS